MLYATVGSFIFYGYKKGLSMQCNKNRLEDDSYTGLCQNPIYLHNFFLMRNDIVLNQHISILK